MRNNKGQFINGHKSVRPVVLGIELVEWTCKGCNIVTRKTRKELFYRKTIPDYCSIKCVYKYSPRKGKVTPDTTRKKLSLQKLGTANPSWRGGVTPLRVKLRNTPEYKEWRRSVFERDDYTCQKCKSRGGKLEADHIIPYMKDKGKLLEVSNGQTLCKECHRKKTTAELKLNWSNQYSTELLESK